MLVSLSGADRHDQTTFGVVQEILGNKRQIGRMSMLNCEQLAATEESIRLSR